jgi:16S rRNA (cytosine1402-N4)-methyltransferase
MEYTHEPVMTREAMDLLRPQPGRRYLDGTVGGGGHAEDILTLSSPDGELVGLDWDDAAIEAARKRLRRFGDRFVPFHVNFTEAARILRELGWGKVSGILLDLGLSSHDLSDPERGFSFQTESRLDMRMDRRGSLDAYQIVNTYSVSELEKILRTYGEEPAARRVAQAIDSRRKKKAIETTKELAEIIAGAVQLSPRVSPRKIHPATRTFQALRIAVNRELENLEIFLKGAHELLLSKGRMVVISFHSLEDRLVKEEFRKWGRNCLCPPRIPVCNCGWSQKARALTRRPLRPSPEEARLNPRSRSARLRAVEAL